MWVMIREIQGEMTATVAGGEGQQRQREGCSEIRAAFGMMATRLCVISLAC